MTMKQRYGRLRFKGYNLKKKKSKGRHLLADKNRSIKVLEKDRKN